MDIKWGSVLFKVFQVYGYWLAITAVYFIAKFGVTQSLRNLSALADLKRKILAYVFCVFIAGGLAWFLAERLGTHTEGDEEDPITVVDYVPSSTNYWTYAAKVFLALLPASLLGVYGAFEEDRKLSREQREERNYHLNRPTPSDDF